MKSSRKGCLLFIIFILMLAFGFAGLDYSSYWSQYASPQVGIEFSSEWGMHVAWHDGMTIAEAVKAAIEQQIKGGSTFSNFKRFSEGLEQVHLLRCNWWSLRRALWRMSVVMPLVSSAPLFDEVHQQGPKKEWKLKHGDYVLFHKPDF